MPTVNFTHDTHIISSTGTTNYGNTNPLNLQFLLSSATRTILNLNWGGPIPEVAVATLRITGASAVSDGSTATIKLLLQSVETLNEDLITWDTWNGVDAWPAANVVNGEDNDNSGAAGVTFSPPTSDGGTVDVDITSLVNLASSQGYENLPLVLRYVNETGSKTAYLRAQESGTFFTLTYTESNLPPGLGGHFAGNFQELKGRIDG